MKSLEYGFLLSFLTKASGRPNLFRQLRCPSGGDCTSFNVRFRNALGFLWYPLVTDSQDSADVVVPASKECELEVERHCQSMGPTSWPLACKERGSTRFFNAGKWLSMHILKDLDVLAEGVRVI